MVMAAQSAPGAAMRPSRTCTPSEHRPPLPNLLRSCCVTIAVGWAVPCLMLCMTCSPWRNLLPDRILAVAQGQDPGADGVDAPEEAQLWVDAGGRRARGVRQQQPARSRQQPAAARTQAGESPAGPHDGRSCPQPSVVQGCAAHALHRINMLGRTCTMTSPGMWFPLSMQSASSPIAAIGTLCM